MKAHSLLAFVLLFSIKIQAQSAFPRYEDEPVWCVTSLNFAQVLGQYTLVMLPDTTICDKVYNGIKAVDAPLYNTGRKTSYIVGYVRQEGQKVYQFNQYADCEEILLYDFSLGVGDTMRHGYDYAPAVVLNIEYERVGSKNRKVFYLNYLDEYVEQLAIWIEGLGESFPINDLDCYSGTACEIGASVYCISTVNEVLFGNCDRNCSVTTATETVSNSAALFTPLTNPMPVGSQIQFKHRYLKIKQLYVINSFGKMIYSEHYNQNFTSENIISHWVPAHSGVYFITIITAEGRRETVKLVVQ